MFRVSYETVRRRVAAGMWPAWRTAARFASGPKRSRPLRSGGGPNPLRPDSAVWSADSETNGSGRCFLADCDHSVITGKTIQR